MRKVSISYIALAIAALMSAACSTVKVGPIKNAVEGDQTQVDRQLNDARSGAKSQDGKVVAVDRASGYYFPVKKIKETAGNPANNVELKRQISLNRLFVSAADFAERVTALTGIPVIVSPDVLQAPTQQGATGAAGATAGAGAMGAAGAMPGLPGLPAVGSAFPTPIGQSGGLGSIQTQTNSLGFPITIAYSGTVGGLMDAAAARMGVSWDMQDGRLKLFRYTSKTFRIRALPGDTSLDAGIGSSGSGGGQSGSSSSSSQATQNSQSSGVKFSGLSVWKGIEESIKSMLSKGVGNVVVAPSLGTVSVTDTPQVLATVERFVDDQNKMLGKQVVVNVQVVSVDLTRTDQYGINWNSVYTALTNNWGFSFNSGVAAITGAGSLTASVLSGAGTGTNSRIQSWQGSSAIIEALATQGHISSKRSASVRTTNNQPAPLQVGRNTSYVASSQTTITQGVSSTSLTPGMVSTGFSMTLLPHIIEGDKMMLQYAIDMSSLLSMTTFSSNNSSIQSPDLDTRTSLQRLMVKSGDLIVVSGFENTELSGQTQGVLDADNPALGGGVNAKRNRSSIVIIIQPIVVDD